MTTVKIVTKSKKRKGQGHGSGKVKTGGRGYKGQNARNPLSIHHSHYEGGQRPLTKRLPYLRGKGNLKSKPKPYLLSLTALSKLPAKTVVDEKFLVQSKIISANRSVKIVSNGTLNVSLVIKVPATKTAVLAITKSGGSYEYAKTKPDLIAEEVSTPAPEAEEKNKTAKIAKTAKK